MQATPDTERRDESSPRASESARSDTARERSSDEGLRFDDPYWDDAFCSWGDPAMRSCCG